MRVPLLVLLAAVVAFLWWLAWPVLVGLAGLMFAAAMSAFVLRYLSSAWRVLTSKLADGPSPVSASVDEPAFAHYLAGQVWRDYAAVLADTVIAVSRPAMLLGAGATQMLVGGWQAILLAPIWLAVVTGLLAAAVGCAVVVLLVSGVYAVIAGLATVAQFAGVGLMRGLDGALVSVRRTRPACPHPGCYRSFPRPEHTCPRCGAAHRDLRPGRHGALRRMCRCGAGLPTSVLLGRSRLAASCPHCHRPLAGSIGHAPLVHMPIVGGPAAGKSTYAHLAIGALREGEGRVHFSDPREAETFAARLAALRQGGRVPRTPVELPQATVLDVELNGAGRCLLYLFDPPGEHYTTSDRIGWQRYLDLAGGMLVIVDPLSLEGVRRSLTDAEVERLADVTSSAEDPAHVIDRLVGALRTRPDGGRLDRVAIVVTKIDAIRRTSVGQPLADGFGPGSVAADQVRDWLSWVGWGNPMRTLDRTARQVRYFGSGLDLPSERLVEPLRWLAEGSLQGRRGWDRVAPVVGLAAEPVSAAAEHTDEVPLHHRLLRRGLLGAVWLFTVASVAILLSVAAILIWRIILP
ncbi:MAG: hypothetical protein GEU94_00790 [Micromonosporaceae bacterium]|nr:hypothetical protein [Micromonosporaceae bacterium]